MSHKISYIEKTFIFQYLSQNYEIERYTIQLLVENGYRGLMSLLSINFVDDLNKLFAEHDIMLAQRSLIRRAIEILKEDNNEEKRIYAMRRDVSEQKDWPDWD